MMNKLNRTYPINLIMNGQQCLVVGGGKIATRKINGLLDVDCQITVVAPKISTTLQALADEGRVVCHQRDFDEHDLDGIFLTFIATGDRALNKHIVQLCKDKNILCCAVDNNWKNSHFITPATVEKDGINIAISTHGTSCRRTRLIKDNLSHHIEMVEKAELLILGTDHNYLNLSERAPYHLLGDRFDHIGDQLSHIWGIHEYMLVNTCNRIELAAIVSPNKKMEGLIKQIMGFNNLDKDSCYIKYGPDAFAHVASALAGLMSQTPGEKHIVNQMKEALALAKEKGWAGAMMQEWLDSTLHVSKHIRQKVEPFLRNFEIEDLTLKYIHAETEDLESKKVLIVGTGVVGRIIAEQLMSSVAEICWCYHRNRPEPLPTQSGASRIVNMKEMKEQLQDVDLVICATSSSVPLIHHGHAPFFDFAKSVLILDLGSPRNVSPELPKLMDNISVIDLDDLKYWFRREAADMSRIFEISHEIITDHMDMYEKIIFHFQGNND